MSILYNCDFMIYQCVFFHTKHIVHVRLSGGNVTTVNAFQRDIDVTAILIVEMGRTRLVVVSKISYLVFFNIKLFV